MRFSLNFHFKTLKRLFGVTCDADVTLYVPTLITLASTVTCLLAIENKKYVNTKV